APEPLSRLRAREAVDLAVHARVEPRIERAQPPRIDWIPQRPAHVLEQEVGGCHRRRGAAARAGSGGSPRGAAGRVPDRRRPPAVAPAPAPPALAPPAGVEPVAPAVAAFGSLPCLRATESATARAKESERAATLSDSARAIVASESARAAAAAAASSLIFWVRAALRMYITPPTRAGRTTTPK